MDKTKQRIAIAEACGWEHYQDNGATQGKIAAGLWWNNENPAELVSLPDYLNDLNAMHEAEKLIIQKCLSPIYGDELRRLCSEQTWSADATKKSEAFLKTLSLWTE